MIEKTNIKIHNKLTKKIEYLLYLDRGYCYKLEFDTRGNLIYYEDSDGFWSKYEYNSEGNRIYYENSIGIIEDDR